MNALPAVPHAGSNIYTYRQHNIQRIIMWINIFMHGHDCVGSRIIEWNGSQHQHTTQYQWWSGNTTRHIESHVTYMHIKYRQYLCLERTSLGLYSAWGETALLGCVDWVLQTTSSHWPDQLSINWRVHYEGNTLYKAGAEGDRSTMHTSVFMGIGLHGYPPTTPMPHSEIFTNTLHTEMCVSQHP